MRTRVKKAVHRAANKARRIRAGIDPVVWRYEIRDKLKAHQDYDGAIVTLTVFNNYGNVIQRYALQHFLAKNGYKFTMLDLHSGIINKNHKNLRRFVKKYLVQEKFDPKLSANHSAYIVGSDQVWRHFSINKTWDRLGIQFLNFVSIKEAKRIAYAASFGVDSLEEAGINAWHRKMIKPQIEKFDAISVREKSGRGLVKELGGGSAVQTLDPTMLLSSDDYIELIDNSVYGGKDKFPPVFYYLIENTLLTKSAIEFYEKKTNSKSFGILPYSKDTPLAPMEEWLKGISDAEIVVTDSYHALVFSIIFHTDFVVFDKNGGGLARIVELLEPLGLADRIIIQEKKKKYSANHKPIDWVKVDKILDKKRKQSGDWLLGCLGES